MTNKKMRDARDVRTTVAALFPGRESAERAVRELKAAGLPGDQIGVAMLDRNAQGAMVADTGTKAGQGAVSGAVGGGVIGGIAGLLIGLGALTIPGIGPVIAAGSLASALGTAGATAVAGAGIGAATGGILGALVGMGIPEERARYFESGVRSGGVIVTAHVLEGVEHARGILERNGGDTAMHLGTTDSSTYRRVA